MIVLITPTGARPDQFKMCMIWMARQTYIGEVTWIIIDDAIPRTTNEVTENFRENWHIIKINPVPMWQRGQNTQSRNMLAGITYIESLNDVKAIFIIEDDDYYKPNYLERMMQRLGKFKVLGEMNTIYYNVYYRNYFINRNTSHSSLFQIALVPEILSLFKNCLNERFMDFKFYEKLHAQGFVQRGEVSFFNENNLAVGMKGMPGRAGIGAGHGRAMNMLPDHNLIYLKQIIGDDAKYYEGYYGNSGGTQHPLLASKRL